MDSLKQTSSMETKHSGHRYKMGDSRDKDRRWNLEFPEPLIPTRAIPTWSRQIVQVLSMIETTPFVCQLWHHNNKDTPNEVVIG